MLQFARALTVDEGTGLDGTGQEWTFYQISKVQREGKLGALGCFLPSQPWELLPSHVRTRAIWEEVSYALSCCSAFLFHPGSTREKTDISLASKLALLRWHQSQQARQILRLPSLSI